MLSMMDYLTLAMSVFAGSSVLLLTGLSLYFKIRKKYPFTVNCWFCNTNTKVPYENKNCWECPSCDQYNGFLSDGDYNKPLPAHYDEDLNTPICPRQEKNPRKKSKVGLCWKCNCNQELKIYQLASFTPINPDKYDQEVESFRKRLEKEYKLCDLCEGVVARTLKKQKEWILGLNFEQLQKKKAYLQKSLKPKVEHGCKWTRKFGPPIIRHLLVLFAGWVSLAHGVHASKGSSPYISYVLTSLPYPVLTFIPWTLECELTLIGAALFAHVIAALLSRHHGSEKRGSTASITFEAICFLMWLSLQTLSWLNRPETREWAVKEFDVVWMDSLVLSFHLETLSYLTFISQVVVAVIPRSFAVAQKTSKGNYSFSRLNIKKSSPCSYSGDFSDGEDGIAQERGKVKNPHPSHTWKDPQQVKKEQKKPDISPTFAENQKSFKLNSDAPSDEDVLGIGNLSLGSVDVTNTLKSGFSPSPVNMPRTKPVIQPARLNLKNIVQSSWVAGGYWQVPSSNQYQFSAPLHAYQLNREHAAGAYFPYQTSPLSRSSSQSSGFVSNAGTASNAPLYNSSSLPGSASSSTCGDQESNSVFSEPAYHKFPATSYYGNIFSGNHGPSFSSAREHTLYGILTAPLPVYPHYPNYYRRERLLSGNHCCCCQNSPPKSLHSASLKTTVEDSDCHSSSSSGFSDLPTGGKSSKISQCPIYKVNGYRVKENKNLIRPGAAILAAMQENVFLLILLGSSLMFNGVMLYLIVVGKGTSLFVS